MSTHRISWECPENSATVGDYLKLLDSNPLSFQNVGTYFQAMAAGSKKGKIRLNYGAVRASGTVALSSFVDGDTITVNGVVFTGKTSPSGANQFAVGSTDQDAANNFVDKVNNSALDLVTGVLKTTRRATLALSSFANNDTVTLNGITYTGKTTPDATSRVQFAIGSSDSVAAENLSNIILSNPFSAVDGISISRSSATLTLEYRGSLTLSVSAHGTATSKTIVVYSIVPGQIGNLCTLAISAHGSVSGANLTGGTEGTEQYYDKNYSAL